MFGAHLAWSGNSQQTIEWLADAQYQWQFGEWLAPGEGRLAPGATLNCEYSSTMQASWRSNSLASSGVHQSLRLPLASTARAYGMSVRVPPRKVALSRLAAGVVAKGSTCRTNTFWVPALVVW